MALKLKIDYRLQAYQLQLQPAQPNINFHNQKFTVVSVPKNWLIAGKAIWVPGKSLTVVTKNSEILDLSFND